MSSQDGAEPKNERRIDAAVPLDWRRDRGLRLFIATALAILLLESVLAVTIGRGPIIRVLPWVEPASASVTAAIGIAIAFSNIGLFRVLRSASSYWFALAFWTNALFTLLLILVSPELLDGASLLPVDPDVWTYVFHLKWTALAVGLFYAPLAKWPTAYEREAIVVGAIVTIASLALGWLVVTIGDRLPAMLTDAEFTISNRLWIGLELCLFGVGCALNLRAHLLRKERMRACFGYIAILELVGLFVIGSDIFGGQVFDVFWYLNRGLLVAAYFGAIVAVQFESINWLETNRRLLAEISRRADELQAVISSISEVVFFCDRDGRIVDTNPAGLRLIGLARKEEATRPLFDYLRELNLRCCDGRQMKIEETALWRALHGQEVREQEEIVYHKPLGRDVDFLVSAAPIQDRKGKVIGVVEVMSDISRLREFDRLKDEFISVAAHELKTPVTVIRGYVQMLLRAKEGLAVEWQKALQAIDRGTARIERIINDLLDISRVRLGRLELHKERFDLVSLVNEVVSDFTVKTPKHKLLFKGPPSLVVEGDRTRIEQVVSSLIDNAVKYSPMGGDIEIAVELVADEAVVAVKDSGIGIPKDRQTHLFEPFYRAHTGTPHDYGGVGVGLFIAREIVKAHGGRIWFESEEGRGSTFSFSIPLPRG